MQAFNSPDRFNPWTGRMVGDAGRYRLDRPLGSGGMGEVFLATDTRLGKPVALKLLKESLAISEDLDLKQRFERECAICAALKSPHIVQVSDYGVTAEGYPFYVMEYLQGQTLGELLKIQPRLTLEHTCNIITQVCAGLQLAHEGIELWTNTTDSRERIKVIHRDLKPANIFLTPTALGELVKVIDFGIAKIHSLQTAQATTTQFFLGTCHYAPPEQFDRYGEVDERADIYSLGMILYEMLTGTDPFGLKIKQQRLSNEIWLSAHASQPVQPLRAQPGCEHLPLALEAVVLKCLHKIPTARFSSVAAFSQALQAVGAGAPVNLEMNAAPEQTAGQTVALGIAAPETVAPETAAIAPTLPQPSTKRQSVPSLPAATPANPAVKSAAMSPAMSPAGSTRSLLAPPARFKPWLMGGTALLALAIGAYVIPRWVPVPFPPGAILSSSDRQFALAETLSGNTGAVWSAVLSPDQQTLISAGEDKTAANRYPIKVWHLDSQQIAQTLEQHTATVRSLNVSEDGQILASGSDDRTVKIWSLASGQLLQNLTGHTAPVQSVDISSDGQTIVSGSEDATVQVWDLRTGKSRMLPGHTHSVYSVALSPDGKTIASGGGDKTIKLWDMATGALIRTLGEPGGHRDAVQSVAFSPDGKQLVSGGWDGFVKRWDTTTGQLLQTYQGHTDRVAAVTFIDSTLLSSASFDHTIKIWNTESEAALQTIPAHAQSVLSVTAGTNQPALVSSSSDTTIKIWR